MADLGFEETELRLGLPGGNDAGDAAAAARKRGFEQTIDLKLKLEQPAAASSAAAHLEEEEQEQEQEEAGDVVAPAVVPLSSPPAAAATTGGAGTTMKRSPSQSSVVTADARPDPEKPRAPKAQAVGWPPVRSFRKNILAVQSQSQQRGGDGKPSLAPPAFVKVSMDGAPYLRKVELRAYGSYQELSKALQKMFSGGGSDEYVPTYEDKDGDWMLVGDVPWEMFVESCKRLRIMKGSEAVGLAVPRAMDKCNNNC